jgi:hypothetical protein
MANHFMLIIWAVYSNKMVSMASNGWLECPNLNQYYAIDYFCFTISCPGGSTITYFNLPMVSVLYDYCFKYLLLFKHVSLS